MTFSEKYDLSWWIASTQSYGKVKKHSEGDQSEQSEQEIADTIHNVIIPSGRVQNRQLGNQSLAAISFLIQQERGTTYNVVSQLKNENSCGYPRTLGCVQLDFMWKILLPGLNYDKYLASRLTTLFPLTNHEELRS